MPLTNREGYVISRGPRGVDIVHPLEFLDVVILALIEGVAGVLPLDERGHRMLLAAISGWQAGAILVAVQAGALLALLLWLWRDVALIGQGLWRLRKGRLEPGLRLLVRALVASLPWIVLNGWLGRLELPLVLVGGVTIVSALMMGVIDAMSMTVKRVEHLSLTDSLIIGLAQLAALLPGMGRLPMAMTASRVIVMERPAAFRFVLLATVPVLLVSILHDGVAYGLHGVAALLGFVVSLGLSWLAVLLANAWLSRGRLLPFALYRLVLGGLMVWLGR